MTPGVLEGQQPHCREVEKSIIETLPKNYCKLSASSVICVLNIPCAACMGVQDKVLPLAQTCISCHCNRGCKSSKFIPTIKIRTNHPVAPGLMPWTSRLLEGQSPYCREVGKSRVENIPLTKRLRGTHAPLPFRANRGIPLERFDISGPVWGEYGRFDAF